MGVFETRHPLNSLDDAHDFSIDPANGAVTVQVGSSVELALSLHLLGATDRSCLMEAMSRTRAAN